MTIPMALLRITAVLHEGKESYWPRLLHAETQSAIAFALENSNESILHHKVSDIVLYHDGGQEACASTSLEQFRYR